MSARDTLFLRVGRAPEVVRGQEFGIKPRTMMFGTLRVKDEVAVHYRLPLVPGDSK